MKKRNITRSVIAALQTRQEEVFANSIRIGNLPFENADRGDGLQHGEVCVANASLFIEDLYNEPLTNYAVGYKDPSNIKATLDFLAPEVETTRRFTYKEWTQIEEFLAENPNGDLRAIGQDFTTVEYTGTEVEAKTDNRGLRLRIDLDQVANPDKQIAGLPAYQARAVEKLKRRLLRNALLRSVAMISAGSINTPLTWDRSAGKDPDGDVLATVLATSNQSGIRPNRVLWGDSAWLNRTLTLRAQNNPAGYSSSSQTPEDAARSMGLQGYRSEERYSAAGAPLAEITGNQVFLSYAQGVEMEDPSNVKRFVSPTEGGTQIRVYVQQVNPKIVDISVEHYDKVILTAALGLNKLTITG